MNKIIINKEQMHWYVNPVPVPKGQIDFSEITFQFSSEWEGMIKTIQFKQEDTIVNALISDNKCFVPSSLDIGDVYIRVRGNKEDDTIVATANEIKLEIIRGFENGGVSEVPPNPDLYAQLLSNINQAESSVSENTTIVVEKSELVTRRADEVLQVSQDFDEHVSDQLSAFDANANDKTTDFNSNVDDKLNYFNQEVIDKASECDSHIDNQVEAFDARVTDETAAFDSNAATKQAAVDASASNAETAKNNAVTAKNDAVSAKTAAETAKADAISAKTAAETAKADALTYKSAAETAKNDAITAKVAAETAQAAVEAIDPYSKTECDNRFYPLAQCNATKSGTIVTIDDALPLAVSGLKLYGKTIQNGTPTPEAPVALQDSLTSQSGAIVQLAVSDADDVVQQTCDISAIGVLGAVGDVSDYCEIVGNQATTHHLTALINSYNGESISTAYISTTGALTTGATVRYVLTTPVVDEPITLSATLTTLDGITNIFAQGTDVAPNMDITYRQDIQKRITTLCIAPKFGVSGVGGSSPTLTRLWDSVGKTVICGTDTIQAKSDFDNYEPFNRKKCVGSWRVVNGKAQFNVQAYEGDADYAEDGTKGDYVAIDIKPFYWYESADGSVLGVSSGAYQGWHIHPICIDKDGNVRNHTYVPAYELAKDANGHAVSLPGFMPIFGSYKNLWDAARTYDGGSMDDFAILEPSVFDHYNALLMTIEFATTNMQSVMSGATNMMYANTDRVQTDGTGVNSVVVTGATGVKPVIGQTIYLCDTYDATPPDASAYNVVTAIEKCDASGTPDSSGTYYLITFSGDARNVTASTTSIVSRPWITGATNTVKGHTGSPVSNSDSKHPCKYRWLENPYGNIYKTAGDLMDVRVAEGDDVKLQWYYNPNLSPTKYYPSSTSKPDLTDLQNDTNGWKLLSVETDKDHYVNGHISKLESDPDYPGVPIVTEMLASSTTYYCDYASLVHSAVVRAVRRRGNVLFGAPSGPFNVFAYFAPSYTYWYGGAGLFMAQ